MVVLGSLLARLNLLESKLLLLLVRRLPSNHHGEGATVLLVALRF
jgi:hypothetical protein